MSDVLVDKSFEGMVRQMRRDLTTLMRRLGRSSSRPSGGTIAERDAMFGVPAGDPARVELANQNIAWFNTDAGWVESYYATTGLPGLTARGLVAGTDSGWYPVGPGPLIYLVASAPQNVTGTNQTITTWAAPGTGLSTRVGGADWFTLSAGLVTTVKAGRYHVRQKTRAQSGSGQVWHYLLSSTLGNLAISNFTLNAAFQNSHLEAGPIIHPAGATFRVISDNGGPYFVQEGGNGSDPMSGEFVVTYVGPPLVSE